MGRRDKWLQRGYVSLTSSFPGTCPIEVLPWVLVELALLISLWRTAPSCNISRNLIGDQKFPAQEQIMEQANFK